MGARVRRGRRGPGGVPHVVGRRGRRRAGAGVQHARAGRAHVVVLGPARAAADRHDRRGVPHAAPPARAAGRGAGRRSRRGRSGAGGHARVAARGRRRRGHRGGLRLGGDVRDGRGRRGPRVARARVYPCRVRAGRRRLPRARADAVLGPRARAARSLGRRRRLQVPPARRGLLLPADPAPRGRVPPGRSPAGTRSSATWPRSDPITLPTRRDDPAARFAGSTYDPTSHYRAVRVIEFFHQQGLDRDTLPPEYARQVHHLASGRRGARTCATSSARPPQAGFLALRTPHAAAYQRALLRDHGVLTDSRGDVLRLGPAPYLTDAQLDAAVAALGAVAARPVASAAWPKPLSSSTPAPSRSRCRAAAGGGVGVVAVRGRRDAEGARPARAGAAAQGRRRRRLQGLRRARRRVLLDRRPLAPAGRRPRRAAVRLRAGAARARRRAERPRPGDWRARWAG